VTRTLPPRWLGRLGIASFAIAAGSLLLLAAGSTSRVVVVVFGVLEGVALVLALAALFWRGRAMPLWSRGVAALTVLGQASFVWAFARGLNQLS
jgi:hypothetical protein